MNAFKTICRAIGALTTSVGVLSLINTIFNLRLRLKKSSLPNDMVKPLFFYLWVFCF